MRLPQEQTPFSFWERIPSRMDEAEILCLKIRNMLQINDLSRYCFSVELLARECLTNAVIHGNLNDADKFVVLRFRIGREWIRLQVSDDGPGFAWRKACQRNWTQRHPPAADCNSMHYMRNAYNSTAVVTRSHSGLTRESGQKWEKSKWLITFLNRKTNKAQ